MEATVESLCTALVRSRLLTPDAVRGLYQRWLRELKELAPDAAAFSRWLVANQFASEFQIGVLARGRGDQLFLNQYKLIDRVGRGRMAGVYKAVHNLGQVVAIKVLPPSSARDPFVFARFLREARLARGLDHPNVVRTFQIAEAIGVHYLVMEYLEGETLAEVLRRRGPLPPEEAVFVVYQALLGLRHLHERGIVHRDLSPENLMLVGGGPNDCSGATVKILDIGTGRAMFDEESEAPKFALTSAGEQLGTPEYTAPEQSADARGADIRADLYSLGCVLFHALAGESPFADKSRVRLLVRHASEAPRPLSAVCPDAPTGLQRVLDRLLAKQVASRYADPEEALQALAPFLPNVARGVITPQQPEYQAFLGWLQTQTVDVEPDDSLDPAAAPARTSARRDAVGAVANSSAGAAPARRSRPLPGRARDAPAVAEEEVTRVAPLSEAVPTAPSADEDSAPVQSVSKKPAGKKAEPMPDGPAESGVRSLMIAAIGVGVVCVLLLNALIVLLLVR
jgi:serine/threonine protein kinase